MLDRILQFFRQPRFIAGDYVVYDELYYGYVVRVQSKFLVFLPNDSRIAWVIEAERTRKAR